MTSLTPASELIAVALEVMEAIRRKDRGALESLLASEFVLRMPGNQDVDRDGFVDIVLKIPGEIESICGQGLAASLFGEVGVVTGMQEAKVSVGPANETVLSRTAFTDVFQRQNGAWHLVLASSVDLSQPE